MLPFFLESESDEDKWAEQQGLFVKIHAPPSLVKCCCWAKTIPSETISSTLLHLGWANRIYVELVFVTLSHSNQEEGVASPPSFFLSMAVY